MTTFFALIYANSYFILLIAAALNSATIAIMGGVAARAGHLSIVVEIIVLALGSTIFNQVYFYLGKKGSGVFHHEKFQHQHATKVIEMISKHESFFVFIYRFFPGIRFISPFILGGSAKFSQLKFLALDVIAAFIWSIFFSAIGFACGEAAKHAFKNFSHYENFAFIIIIGLFVLWLVIRKIKQYKKTRSIWHKSN